MSALARLLFIVSRDNHDQYEVLKRHFAGEERVVEVVLDRRKGERRVDDVPPEIERRRGEDRRQHNIEGELQAKGWALIRRLA